MGQDDTQQTLEQVASLIKKALVLADLSDLTLTAIYLEQALDAIRSDAPSL